MAFRLDPDLAERLIDELDDDPRRNDVKAEMAFRAQANRQEKLLADGRTDALDVGLLCEWSAYLLREINVGRASGPQMETLVPGLRRAGLESLSRVYPVFDLGYGVFLEKVGRTQRPVPQLKMMLGGLIDSLVIVEEIGGGRPVVELDGAAPQEMEDAVVVAPQRREVAESFLARWFEQQDGAGVTIVDPYFTLADLDLLRLFHRSVNHGSVRIVTGASVMGEASDLPSRVEIEGRWREMCSDPLPRFEILAVSTVESHRCPFHDRWVLSERGGLRLGTSFSGFGRRVSEISRMPTAKAVELLEVVERYCDGREQFLEGERLTTSSRRM